MALSLVTLPEPLGSCPCTHTCTHSHHPMGHTLKPLDLHKHVHVHVCKHTSTYILIPTVSDSVSNPHAHTYLSPHAHSPHRPMNSPAPTLSHSNTSVSAHSLLHDLCEGPSLKLQLKLSLSSSLLPYFKLSLSGRFALLYARLAHA